MPLTLSLLFLVVALVLGALAVIRSRGNDLVGWGVLLIAAVLIFRP